MDYEIPRQSMICARADAEQFIYRKVEDRSGNIWLWPVNSDSPAEQVHVHRPADTRSEGYGGATLHFLLEDGTTYAAKGPWHSNADAMFMATGIDLRNTHWTFGCIALDRTVRSYTTTCLAYTVMLNVVYLDKEPVLGNFNRIKNLAQDWADAFSHPVMYYSQSRGGSSNGPVYPTGQSYKDWPEWPRRD